LNNLKQNTMKTKFYLPLLLFALMIACSPATKLEKSWADPSLTPGNVKQFKKVLVVAKLKDESARRIAEDKIAKEIKGIAVPSYSYLTSDDTDEAQLTAKLKNDGFDGIIIMQLKEVEKSTSYTPGTVYAGGWYGGYRGGYGGVYGSPGYYSEDKTFYTETTVFSLADNKLLWSGVTSSLNPSKVEKTIDEVIYAIKLELQNKGLISKTTK
jgi:hypothetical protein